MRLGMVEPGHRATLIVGRAHPGAKRKKVIMIIARHPFSLGGPIRARSLTKPRGFDRKRARDIRREQAGRSITHHTRGSDWSSRYAIPVAAEPQPFMRGYKHQTRGSYRFSRYAVPVAAASSKSSWSPNGMLQTCVYTLGSIGRMASRCHKPLLIQEMRPQLPKTLGEKCLRKKPAAFLPPLPLDQLP